LAELVRPAGTEDIGHGYRHGGGIVFQEGLFYGQIDPVEGFDIPLRRGLGAGVWRSELVGIRVDRQLGLGLEGRSQLDGEACRQLEIAVELTEIAPHGRLGRLVEVARIDMRIVEIDV